ncbi:MAG: hypothetical protein LBN18_05470 [Dysgonamonadaceae bacterium]|jgi:hypothetical protein|nr:hypothetical protein [Dysgonamonadaceae bacterium]
MNAHYAIKGYIIQTLVAVLDSFNDKEWLSVCVEPDNESEKVDICWEYSNGTKKVMQVKSSINPFALPAVTKWANELETNCPNASEYTLCLVGRMNDATHTQQNNKIGNVDIKNIDISISDFNTLILSKINDFFENKNRNKISNKLAQLFALSLNQQFLLNSSVGKVLNRFDFEQYLLNDLIAVERYLEQSAYSLLLPAETVERDDIKTTIIKHILHLIGWSKPNVNECVTIHNDKLDQDEEYKVEFWSNYKSRLKDNENDVIYINSSLEAEYQQNIQALIKQNIYSTDLVREQLINQGKIAISNLTEHSIQFLLSTKETDLDRNLINEISTYYKSNILNKDLIYYVIDNKKANFLISSIITARTYRPELSVKFLYPITEDTSTLEKIGKRDIYLPPQYINSSIIPIVKEDNNKISVLMFCSDEYSRDRLKKIIWMLIRLTSGLANEYIVYFPDYKEEYQNEVNEVVRSYNNDELTNRLRIQQLKICETVNLQRVPAITEDLLNTEFDETKNKKKKIFIQSHLLEYLPYGDSIKPFLNSPTVLTPELKVFLSRKGVYFKNADRTKMMHLMTGLLFSPMEIESLVGLVETKDKTLDSSQISYPLLQHNIPFAINSFNFQELGNDLKAKVLAIEPKQISNSNNFTIEVHLEQVNPNKQALVSSVFSRAIVSGTFNQKENKFEVNKEYNSRPARTIAERIEKAISTDLIQKNVIEEKSVKISFSDFENRERVNFLLSFTNIDSSLCLQDYDVKAFKYMFDESIDLPLEYQDKKGKEYVTQSKGKNLDGVKELQDENFKTIILCEEIIINYKFNIRGVYGNYYTILNFSDALKNKPIPDGVFQFKSKVYLNTKNKAKVPNIQTLENELKIEFRRLLKEKLNLYNKI